MNIFTLLVVAALWLPLGDQSAMALFFVVAFMGVGTGSFVPLAGESIWLPGPASNFGPSNGWTLANGCANISSHLRGDALRPRKHRHLAWLLLHRYKLLVSPPPCSRFPFLGREGCYPRPPDPPTPRLTWCSEPSSVTPLARPSSTGVARGH